MDDIFCKIINQEVKDNIFDEGENWIAVKDIHPQAPVHLLIIPKKHIQSIESIKNEDRELIGEMISAAKKVAEKAGLSEGGYRLIINQGENGGQAVMHLHIHLLGGKKLGPKICSS